MKHGASYWVKLEKHLFGRLKLGPDGPGWFASTACSDCCLGYYTAVIAHKAVQSGVFRAPGRQDIETRTEMN